MELKGLLLLGAVRTNGYDMYFVTVSADLWGADALSLLSRQAASAVTRLEYLRDVVMSIEGHSLGLPAVSDVVSAFPPYLDEGLPFQLMSTLLLSDAVAYTPFGAKLAYVEVKPFYDILVSSTPLSVNACYCGFVKATYYRPKTLKPLPYLPYLPTVFRFPAGKLYLPSYQGFSARMKVYAAEFHSDGGHSLGWLRHRASWYDVPDTELWHYRHTPKQLALTRLVDPDMSVSIDYVLSDNAPNLTSAYSAEHPSDTSPFDRVSYYGYTELSLWCDGEGNHPLLDTIPGVGVYVPVSPVTKSSFGGVLACAVSLNSIFFPDCW